MTIENNAAVKVLVHMFACQSPAECGWCLEHLTWKEFNGGTMNTGAGEINGLQSKWLSPWGLAREDFTSPRHQGTRKGQVLLEANEPTAGREAT